MGHLSCKIPCAHFSTLTTIKYPTPKHSVLPLYDCGSGRYQHYNVAVCDSRPNRRSRYGSVHHKHSFRLLVWNNRKVREHLSSCKIKVQHVYNKIIYRYSHLEPIGIGVSGLVWYDIQWLKTWNYNRSLPLTIAHFSSARDQITKRTIAVKKLAQPFKSENIAKHMYREVRLLKTLKHENVCLHTIVHGRLKLTCHLNRLFIWMTFLFHPRKICKLIHILVFIAKPKLTLNTATLWQTSCQPIYTLFWDPRKWIINFRNILCTK